MADTITANISSYPTAISASLSTYMTSISTNFVETTLEFLDGAGLNIENTFSQDNHFLQDVSIDGDLTGVDSITFDTTGAEASAVGKLKWNDEDGTLDLGLKGGNVTLQVGQEMVVRAVNKTNTNLLEANYQVARIRTEAEGGSQGQRLAIILAQANNDNNSVDTLGLVTENINNNQEGFVTTFGLVRNIDTTGSLQGEDWGDGDVLYLSPTIAGRLTKVKPEAPQHTVIVGFVVYSHQNNGKIFVKVDNGYEINELHNVKINGVTNNSLLTYDSGLSVWKNTNSVNVSTLSATSLSAGSIITTGGVTANNLVYKGGNTEGAALTIGTNDAQDLNFETNGNNRMTVKSDGYVSIGTTTPTAKFTLSNNNAVLDPVLTQATFIAHIVDDTNNASGVQMTNTNTGTSADFRFLIKDNTGHYFAFVQPGVNNNLPGLFDLTRKNTDFIFNAGGTGRDIAIGTTSSNDLIFATNNTQKVRITSGGNVGIGTATPNEKLTVVGNISASGGVTANNLVYKGGNTEGAALTVGTNDAQDLNFETNGSTRMSITSAGGVVVNTAGLLPKFTILTDLNTGDNDNSPLLIQGVGANKPAAINLRTTGGGSEAYKGWMSGLVGNGITINPQLVVRNGSSGPGTGTVTLIANNFGNVGINTSTPNEKLTVVGNISATGSLSARGELAVDAASTANQTVKIIARNTNAQTGDDSAAVEVWGQNTAKFIGRDNGGTQKFNFGYDSNQGDIAALGYGGGTAIRINSAQRATVGATIDTTSRLAVIDETATTGSVVSVSGTATTGVLLKVSGTAGSGGSLFTAFNTSGAGFRLTETGAMIHNQTVTFSRSGGADINLGGINNTNTIYTQNSGNHTATDFLLRGGIADRTAGNLLQVRNFNIPVLTISASTSAGNVGIGTSTPLNKLHVVGKDATSGSDFIALFQEPGITPQAGVVIGNAADRSIMVQGAGGAFYLGRDVTNDIEFAMGTSVLGEAFAGASTNHNFSLRTNNIKRLTCSTNGNVGIGTETPNEKLTVVGNISATGTSNRLPNQTASTSDSIMTLAMVEELYGWELLLGAAYQTYLSGSGVNATGINSSSFNTGDVAGNNVAGFKIADNFNRSPMGHTVTDFQSVPYQTGKTRIKFQANLVTFVGDGQLWCWNGIPSTTPLEFPTALGFGMVMTPTTIQSVVHNNTTHILGNAYTYGTLPHTTVQIEVEYYQGVCITKLNGVAVSTVSGGFTSYNPQTTQNFYARTSTGGVTNKARVELKNIKYRITQS